MPNIIDATGLTVDTAAEVTAELTTGLQGIYGNTINVESNSPDGEAIGIFTQIIIDLLELLVQINNSFDPDQASGSILDQRVAINNIARQGGTYTIQPIDIVVNASVPLAGLDDQFSNPNGTGYTVQDSAGNLFILENTITIAAGSHSLNFRAQQIGAVDVAVNTITSPVTIVLGVVSINNGTGALSVGQLQETDAQLRTRRQQSVALATTGYLNGLLGAILDLPGVTEAVLYENVMNIEDDNGTPPHCIWLVVAGGASSDIANEIYTRISYGCDMRGDVTFTITTLSGIPFVAKWDTPVAEPLHIKFNLKQTVSGFSFDQSTIKSKMTDLLVYKIGAFADTSGPTAAAQAGIAAQGGGGVPIDVLISTDGMTWMDYIDADTPASQFTTSAGNITISVI